MNDCVPRLLSCLSCPYRMVPNAEHSLVNRVTSVLLGVRAFLLGVMTVSVELRGEGDQCAVSDRSFYTWNV